MCRLGFVLLPRPDHDRELVTAVAGDECSFSGGILQAARDVDQHPVAGGVPVSVVDPLEAVEIDEDQRDRPTVS